LILILKEINKRDQIKKLIVIIKMKKAQMSLEMIIGLLILLVVAVVVINIFLTQMKKTETFNSFDKTLEYNKYKSDCESYCNQFINKGELAYGVQFCTHRLFKEGSTKLMKKGVVDKIELSKEFPLTKGYPVCEDAIYCFHITSCESIDWEDCPQILCRYYYNTYKDRPDISDPWSKADEKVKEIMPNGGSCKLPDDENWWKIYFGPKACTSPGQSPSEQTTTTETTGEFSITLQNCQINSEDLSFTCNVEYTGTCSNEDIGIMASDSNKEIIAYVLPVNPADQGGPLGSVNWEENKISGKFNFAPGTTDSLTPGPCYLVFVCGDIDHPAALLDANSGNCVIQ